MILLERCEMSYYFEEREKVVIDGSRETHMAAQRLDWMVDDGR